MKNLTMNFLDKYYTYELLLNYLQPIFLLFSRLYILSIFLPAGLSKLKDWESTMLLFEYEYTVPILSFKLAAYLATFGELVFPIMLALGLGVRFSAIGLFIINVVAVISLEDMPPAAFNLHVIWGVVLGYLMLFGDKFVSLDRILYKLSLK